MLNKAGAESFGKFSYPFSHSKSKLKNTSFAKMFFRIIPWLERRDLFQLFGEDQKNESATRKDTDEVIDIMKDFMSQISGQFNEVNSQFDEVTKRLDRLDRDYDHLISTIDSFIGRTDKYETELAARDNQFEKLLTRARKVSEKAGIPLE